MRALYLFSVWLHVLAAVTWLGSAIFLVVVLVPTLRAAGDESIRAQVLRVSGPRLRILGWTCFGILVATGVINLAGRGFDLSDLSWRLWAGPFGHALVWKLALFAVLLLISAVHDFRLGPRASHEAPGSPAALRFRRAASWMGRLELLLGLAILAFAIMLVRGWP